MKFFYKSQNKKSNYVLRRTTIHHNNRTKPSANSRSFNNRIKTDSCKIVDSLPSLKSESHEVESSSHQIEPSHHTSSTTNSFPHHGWGDIFKRAVIAEYEGGRDLREFLDQTHHVNVTTVDEDEDEVSGGFRQPSALAAFTQLASKLQS
jgi:pyridoxal/pyridoxine/pyridoxamine kinase